MASDGYTVQEIVSDARITARTLRQWSAEGLFEPPPFRGGATRYSDAHRARIIEIAKLRRQGLNLAAIRQRLAREDAESARRAALESAAARTATPPTPANYPAQKWERLILVPGLELHVDAGGGELLRRMAQNIYDWFGRGDETQP